MKCWVAYEDRYDKLEPKSTYLSKEEAIETARNLNLYYEKYKKHAGSGYQPNKKYPITKLQKIEIDSDYLLFKIMNSQGAVLRDYFLYLIKIKDSHIKFGEMIKI